MSNAYDAYLNQHKRNVNRALNWLMENVGYEKISDILPELDGVKISGFNNHDASKTGSLEYPAYDKYFYGPNGVKNPDGPSEEVKNEFNYAWLNHIHQNPHHWQYWVLVNDDKELGSKALEIPDRYILEMICDWWSFSFAKGDLYELFHWWNDHSDYILLGEKTRVKVVKILNLILDKVNELGGEVTE